jgi:transposase
VAEADIAAIEAHLEPLKTAPARSAQRQPKRRLLPSEQPLAEIRHEPHATPCACGSQLKRRGEDISEKLNYPPDVFTVERHTSGKWVCAAGEGLIQAPMPAHIIDKGISTTGLLPPA